MKRIIQIFFFIPFISLSQFIFADDAPLNGAELTKKYCAECHGETGNSTIDRGGVIPNIAGFSAILIFDTLSQFKDGDRKALAVKNKAGQLSNMSEISKKLSEQEAEAISLFLSEQKFTPTKQVDRSNDEKLAAQGKLLHQDLCDDCHGEFGTSPVDDAPILAGQGRAYLIRQFDQISKQERYIPKRMKRKFRKLNNKDKLALIEFYTK